MPRHFTRREDVEQCVVHLGESTEELIPQDDVSILELVPQCGQQQHEMLLVVITKCRHLHTLDLQGREPADVDGVNLDVLACFIEKLSQLLDHSGLATTWWSDQV